jgi:hypothetical protein
MMSCLNYEDVLFSLLDQLNIKFHDYLIKFILRPNFNINTPN